MDALLARYIEGELDANEVTAFLEAVERSPRLEAELRAYEAVLAAAGRPVNVSLGPDFTDRVMAEAVATQRPTRVPAPRRALATRHWLATAALVLLMFTAGWLVSRQLAPAPPTSGGGSFVMPAAWKMPAGDVDGVQFVRLVYQPTTPSPGQVSVAGSFNGWDPSSIAMTFDGQVWSAVLALPPGSYEYMFVEDGERWVTDPLAPRTRSDGFGGVNAVLDLTA